MEWSAGGALSLLPKVLTFRVLTAGPCRVAVLTCRRQRMLNPPRPPAARSACPACCRWPSGGSLLGWIGTPRRGGIGAPSAGGPPDQMRHIFRAVLGALVHRAAAVAVDPVVGGMVSRTASPHSAPEMVSRTASPHSAPEMVSRTASPHSAPEQPASPAGHPSCASLRRDSHDGRRDECVRGGGGEPWDPGAMAAMGSLERSSDQLPNGPVVGGCFGGSFIGAAIGTKRQPSPRLGCETRSGCKRAV